MRKIIVKPLIKKLSILFLVNILLSVSIQAQHPFKNIDSLFEKIRKSEVMLQLFFSQMPKGGDLHNHLTGSVYAETYFDIGCKKNMWLDTLNFKLNPPYNEHKIRLSESRKDLNKWRSKCIDNWSIFNYDASRTNTPPDEFFFKTFGDFGAATQGHYEQFLKELRTRAKLENVSYLEIMVSSPEVHNKMISEEINEQIKNSIATKNTNKLNECLLHIYKIWEQDIIVRESIEKYVRTIDSLHNVTKSTAPDVITSYQVYATRNAEPIKVFAQLYIGYKACNQSANIVGVNIVQPEDNEISIRNYWGHMNMFGVLSSLHKVGNRVNTSIHAGELVLGMVAPEHLSNHINEAVNIAQARRIGHGVDIAFETSVLDLLKKMKQQHVAVEINLTSNEFILGVKDDEHPIMLYFKSGIPIVISTDDAGILRTNLSEQFVLAAKRYPELTYTDLKNFIFNSIDYSFAPENIKNRLKGQLVQDISVFEKKMLEEFPAW